MIIVHLLQVCGSAIKQSELRCSMAPCSVSWAHSNAGPCMVSSNVSATLSLQSLTLWETAQTYSNGRGKPGECTEAESFLEALNTLFIS
jgi:hypothetical protein